MKIVDMNGKEREALSLKIVSHQIPDAIGGGIAVVVQYVEAQVQGKHRKGTWIEWYPLVEFQINNPKIKL